MNQELDTQKSIQMNRHIVVCDFDESLIDKLNGEAIVANIDMLEDINHVDSIINEQNKTHCIVYRNYRKTVSGINFTPEWEDIPLLFYLKTLGSFKEFIHKMPIIQNLDIRIYLPASQDQNITNCRIMASLGIDCGLYFDTLNPNWDALIDLAAYVSYGRVQKASIEPLNYVIDNYDPQELTDFSSVYFNDPNKYIHLDKYENISLTSENLQNKKYLCSGFEKLDNVFDEKNYYNEINSWQKFFLKEEGCAYCPAWRVCMGKFSEAKSNDMCKELFSDLMDAADFANNMNHENPKQLCQL